MKVLDYKEPAEAYEETVRFDDLLDTGETISYANAIASLARGATDDSANIVESVTQSASTALIVLRRGTTGQDYAVKVLVSTSGSNVWTDDLVLRVWEFTP